MNLRITILGYIDSLMASFLLCYHREVETSVPIQSYVCVGEAISFTEYKL